jgi:hypothetical protein
MTDTATKVLAGIGGGVIVAPIILLFALAGAFWRAWWLYPAWDWFVVPIGIRPITFSTFVGLSIIVSAMTHDPDMKEDKRPTSNYALLGLVIGPPVVWLALWWIHGR